MKLQVGNNQVGKGRLGKCGICGRVRDTELIDGHYVCGICRKWWQAGISNAANNLALPLALVVFLIIIVIGFDLPVDWQYVPRLLGF